MMGKRINICLSCDENYAKYAGVVIASILSHSNNDEELHIYILDGQISQDSKNKIESLKSIKDCDIEFISINEKDFEDYKNIPNHDYISISTYYRLKLATLLPTVDKIIYLDCDVIVCNSLSELFNIDLQGNVLGGVLDIDLHLRDNSKYINAGVLLMDLKKIREQNIEDQFLHYAQNNWQNIKLGDQGVINDVLKDRILNINAKFNLQSESYLRRSSFTKNPTIIHYIGGKKPWHYGSWSIHKNLYFKYLQFTPWKLSPVELLMWLKLNPINSFLSWFKHRPFFYLQKKFWIAVTKDINTHDEPKIFVVILLACFGDAILCNSLFQNIKRLYPNSKTVFIVNKPYAEAAKFQKDIDKVIIFDKKGANKGLLGMLKFLKSFPYKNVYCLIKTHETFRINLLSFFIKAKEKIGKPYDYSVTAQKRHLNLLKKITKEPLIDYPLIYNADNTIPEKLNNLVFKNKKYVALCTTSSQIDKDMPIQIAIEVINKLNNEDFEILFVGMGNKALEYAQELEANNCKFINLVNKTTIYELAQVLRNCKGLISVDTGTMHFGYANGVPTVCVFYKQENILGWMPSKKLYKNINIPDNINSSNEIYNSLCKLLEGENL